MLVSVYVLYENRLNYQNYIPEFQLFIYNRIYEHLYIWNSVWNLIVIIQMISITMHTQILISHLKVCFNLLHQVMK